MAKPTAETGFRQEVRKIEEEPLLPVEKRLIAWSLILGAIGLVLLVWISYTFFPAAAPPP